MLVKKSGLRFSFSRTQSEKEATSVIVIGLFLTLGSGSVPGLRKHIWPLESGFLTKKSEKRDFTHQTGLFGISQPIGIFFTSSVFSHAVSTQVL